MSSGQTMPTIGIIGAGNIGAAFARALARAGLPAVIANSRGPDSLTMLLTELGGDIRAGTREQAATQDIVLVAVPWPLLPAALSGLPTFGDRIVIDANNAAEVVFDPADPGAPPEFRVPDLEGKLSSKVVGDLVPGARLVKAFNHLPAQFISDDPHAEGGRRVLFFSGDDSQANAQVGALIERLGFFGIDLGGLSTGGRLAQFPGGPLPLHNLVKFG